jgi:hypothetical protein
LGIKLFGLVWSQFFDDFTQVEPAATCPSAWMAAEFLFDLLGWQWAAAKRSRPSSSFVALGVVLTFPTCGDELVIVSNKPGRAEALTEVLVEARGSGKFPPAAAASFVGRVNYLRSQLFGRVGILPLRVLMHRSSGKDRTHVFTLELESAILMLLELVRDTKPRGVAERETKPHMVLFTDGAAEGTAFSNVTVGAVLLDPFDDHVEFFGLPVPGSLLEEWRAQGAGEQVIGQAEILPVVFAREVWHLNLRGRRLLVFIDIDSARFALIKADSPSAASRGLLERLSRCDSSSPVPSWYARCPSASNIADGPSRMQLTELMSLYPAAKRVEVSLTEQPAPL